ncbi:MAG: DUF4105 domain-containing protein [Cyclobacteriaceae bacterium]
MNFLRALILVFSFSLFQGGFAQGVRGENLEIAVMTLGPYQGELYSAFGHSAVRVYDTSRNVDYVFNWGVFDFDQENFYWNFARGKMLYQLGLGKYERFKNAYVRDNRYIVEQYLNLTPEEKLTLYNYLLENYKPENREYYYNYVYDNCSSRIRDILRNALGKEIKFNYDYVEEDLTIRDLMDRYLEYQPWGDWIIDIGLGYQIDKIAAPEEYMFLPDYLQKGLEGSTITRGSTVLPLISKTVNVYKSKPEENAVSIWTPFNTFVVVFFVIGFFTNRDFKTGKRTHWIDVLLYTFVGIFGWWCTFLWTGTVHLSESNMNLLWATPLHIPFIYFLKVKKYQKFLSKYFLVTSILYLLLLIFWGILPQPLHEAIIPIILAMVLRGFFINYDLNKVGRKG